MTSESREKEFIDDCKRYWKKALTGEKAHRCPEWDFMPIDETCHLEFECCSCEWRIKNDQ